MWFENLYVSVHFNIGGLLFHLIMERAEVAGRTDATGGEKVTCDHLVDVAARAGLQQGLLTVDDQLQGNLADDVVFCFC